MLSPPGSYRPRLSGVPGSVLPVGSHATDNFGRTWFGNGGFANNIYGNMRNWRNVVNSNYNALQLSLTGQNHAVTMNAQYTLGRSKGNSGGSNEAITAGSAVVE